MRNRIFAGGGFKAHRPAGRDEAIDPVSTAHLSIVTCFRRCSSDSQVNRAFISDCPLH